MELKQALDLIKKSIAQGSLEEAYDQLITVLEAPVDYAELANIARVNQADLYQLKAQILKGTISDEDARLIQNQLADKALQIVRQLETGKIHFAEDIKPTSSKALRYYIAGGIVTLAAAILLWQFLDNKEKEDSCPVFSPTAELKVMILPFKQTGTEKMSDPAFDIMDQLNDLIEKTPGLRVRAIADVNENYDIDKDYPNSAQAVEIAQNCAVQMLVWGKVRQLSGENYTLDMRYRLLDAGGVRFAGDTTINRLLTVTEEANWVNDVQSISNRLYVVLANQLQVQIAANMLEELHPSPTISSTTDSLPPVDSSTSFLLADYYIMKKDADKAIAELDLVLEQYPDNATARKKRGALLLQKKDYSSAARDLEAVSLKDSKSNSALREARIKAYLESGQPEKAKHEVEAAQSEKTLDGAWLNQKSKEVQDSTVALEVRRDVIERQASVSRDPKLRVRAAKANLGLGETESALKYTDAVLRSDPRNLEAIQVAVDAQLQEGDTAKAVKTLDVAKRAGANVKSIHFAPVLKAPLPDPDKKQE